MLCKLPIKLGIAGLKLGHHYWIGQEPINVILKGIKYLARGILNLIPQGGIEVEFH